MKKNILLIATALFLFIGNQSVTAQVKMKKNVQSINTEKSEAKAKKMTTNLIRPLGLDQKQQEQVYSLFVKTESKMNRVSAAAANVNEQDAKQAKMDKYVMSSMKEILTEEQFNTYMELSKKL